MMMAKHITMEPISASLARVSLTAVSVVRTSSKHRHL